MASAFSQLAGAPLANILVLAGLVCIAIAIFGWARETIAASAGFRTVSGLTGVFLLFFVYGIYLPRAARSNDVQRGQSTEERPPETEQALKAWQIPPAPSAQAAAQNSPLATRELQTTPSAAQQSTKRFDVNSARRSGYSDEEILDYLAKSRSFDAAGALRAGYSKSEVIDYLAGMKSTPAVQSAQLPTQSASSSAPQTTIQPATPAQQQPLQAATAQAAAEDLFSGRWKNADPKAASILYLKVEERGDEITVRAWGRCLPQQANRGDAGVPASQYCDWGTGQGVVRDGEANVTWKQGAVLRRMKLLPDGGSLRVVLDSTSRGRSQHMEAHFAKSL